jgi:hypothetical protein
VLISSVQEFVAGFGFIRGTNCPSTGSTLFTGDQFQAGLFVFAPVLVVNNLLQRTLSICQHELRTLISDTEFCSRIVLHPRYLVLLVSTNYIRELRVLITSAGNCGQNLLKLMSFLWHGIEASQIVLAPIRLPWRSGAQQEFFSTHFLLLGTTNVHKKNVYSTYNL